mmetsp:Transcript_11181/g.24077  ORF Transcript_11181/g.24077 Transcript_11181/m.24077 type:complete len:159 (+) Transcript_11181:831-1307(+)
MRKGSLAGQQWEWSLKTGSSCRGSHARLEVLLSAGWALIPSHVLCADEDPGLWRSFHGSRDCSDTGVLLPLQRAPTCTCAVFFSHDLLGACWGSDHTASKMNRVTDEMNARSMSGLCCSTTNEQLHVTGVVFGLGGHIIFAVSGRVCYAILACMLEAY